MSAIITNCARCGMGIERNSIGLLKERRKDDLPLFRLVIKQPKKKNGIVYGEFEYHNVVLCEDCQDSLWRWIYCRDDEPLERA